jgi:DNA-binding GntR family transcriptional regulator
LLRLVQESLVTVLSRHGYRVKAPSISDIEEILNLRSLIEPACAAAAAKASDTAAQALERFRGFVTQNFKEIRYIDYNGSFHSAIAKSSGNERLAAVAFDLIQQFQLIVWTLPINSNHESVRRDCAEHEAMIDAIQAHDAERAFQLAHEHTEGTRERVRTALRGRVGEPAPL